MNLQTQYEAAQDYAQAQTDAFEEAFEDTLTQVEELKVYQLLHRLPPKLKTRLAGLLEDYTAHLMREEC